MICGCFVACLFLVCCCFCLGLLVSGWSVVDPLFDVCLFVVGLLLDCRWCGLNVFCLLLARCWFVVQFNVVCCVFVVCLLLVCCRFVVGLAPC